MKKIATLLACVVCASCTHFTQPVGEAKPSVSIYSDGDFRQYVDDANIALLVYFNYVRTLNKIAIGRGWKPPDRAPICEHVPWGMMRLPPPLIIPDSVRTADEINEHLVAYIKLTRELYTLQKEEFENLEKYANELCSY